VLYLLSYLVILKFEFAKVQLFSLSAKSFYFIILLLQTNQLLYNMIIDAIFFLRIKYLANQ